MANQFCLKWNNYQQSLTTAFRHILEEEHFVDVTLTAEKENLRAHKVVLSACSPYFSEILKGINPWQHPVLVLKDISFLDLQSILEFIYLGEVNVEQERLDSFLSTAEVLKINGLTFATRDGGQAKEPPATTAGKVRSRVSSESKTTSEMTEGLKRARISSDSVPSSGVPSFNNGQVMPPIGAAPFLFGLPTPIGVQTPPEKRAKTTSSVNPPPLHRIKVPESKAVTAVDENDNDDDSMVIDESVYRLPAKQEPEDDIAASDQETEDLREDSDNPLVLDDTSNDGSESRDESTVKKGQAGSAASSSGDIFVIPGAPVFVAAHSLTGDLSNDSMCSSSMLPSGLLPTTAALVATQATGTSALPGGGGGPHEALGPLHKRCPVCQMVMLKKNLSRHIRDQHAGTERPRSVCPLCWKTYKTQDWLKDHVRRGHGYTKAETDELMAKIKAGNFYNLASPKKEDQQAASTSSDDKDASGSDGETKADSAAKETNGKLKETTNTIKVAGLV